MHKLVSIVGARPQFIKAAALSRAIRDSDSLQEIMVHTGQHFDDDMSEIFFQQLEIPAPGYHLDIHGGDHAEMTGRMLLAIEKVLEEQGPDMVLVYGDTNTTLAGALTAAKLNFPVAHVEAGLRSFNKRMPEEINRLLTDHLSALLFCPTGTAARNLDAEGITLGVYQVGDVMYDCSLFAAERTASRLDILTSFNVTAGEYAVATVHRQESTDDVQLLGKIIGYLKSAARELPVVFPVHPRTRLALSRNGIDLDGLLECLPLGYLEMAALVSRAAVVYTDSGGLQKEAYFYRVPCVTLRGETEWVETVEAGWNRLWSVDEYMPRSDIDEYGDGTSAKKIVAAIEEFFAP